MIRLWRILIYETQHKFAVCECEVLKQVVVDDVGHITVKRQ